MNWLTQFFVIPDNKWKKMNKKEKARHEGYQRGFLNGVMFMLALTYGQKVITQNLDNLTEILSWFFYWE
jgi:hypothetical protein